MQCSLWKAYVSFLQQWILTFARNHVLASDYIWVTFMCFCEWVIASYCHLCATQPENSAPSSSLCSQAHGPYRSFLQVCAHIYTRGTCIISLQKKKPLRPKNKCKLMLVFWILWLYLYTMLLTSLTETSNTSLKNVSFLVKVFQIKCKLHG